MEHESNAAVATRARHEIGSADRSHTWPCGRYGHLLVADRTYWGIVLRGIGVSSLDGVGRGNLRVDRDD